MLVETWKNVQACLEPLPRDFTFDLPGGITAGVRDLSANAVQGRQAIVENCHRLGHCGVEKHISLVQQFTGGCVPQTEVVRC